MNFLLFSLLLPYAPATDSLCFENADPEIAKVGIPVLGELGVKEGICQGIAGVTAAFLENAEFSPETKSPDGKGGEHLIQQLVSLHRKGVRAKITVPGAKNLKEFCEQNKRAFMREAILYNAEIAADKILPLTPQLFGMKDQHLKNAEDQQHLASELQSLQDQLKNGHYPLMLYYKHVVMVTEMRLNNGKIEVSVYDSNHPDVIIQHDFPVDQNGLPTLQNHMVWAL